MFTMIKFVWKKAIDCKAVLISSFFCILISNFLSLVIMFVTGAIFDTLYSGKEIDLLVKFCVLYTVTFIGSIVFSFLGNLLTAKANNQIMYKINRDVLQKIHTISLLDVRSENAASLTQKINNDSYQVSSFFLEFFSNSVINLIMGLFAICYTFYYNLGIALILIGSISAYALLYSLLRKKVYISSLSYKEAQGLFFGKLYEQLNFLPFIKAFEASSKMLNQLDSAFSILYKKAIVYQNTSFSFSMLDSFFEIVIQVLFFIVSGVYIFHQKMSIGEFSILLSLSRTSMRGIKYFFSMGKNLQETKASFDRISKIVCASVPKDGTYKLVEIHSINLTGLNFQYRSKVVFKNLNYSFYEGYIYGVLGEN